MTPEELQYLEEMEMQYKEERLKNVSGQMGLASTLLNSERQDNLIKFQLDNKQELQDFERLLRGHVPKTDEKGNEFWIEPTKEQELFNEKGVREIMKRLSTYLFKSIMLSNYSEDQINARTKEFGHAIKDFIYLNAEEFGLDTDEKISYFEMVIIDILNLVESAYLRALNGEERKGINTARIVTQNEGFTQNNGISRLSNTSQSKFSILNPKSWF
jgi:hypothetical protein